MGKVAICYFSGTGNSLQVARELAKRLPGAELVPVMGRLGQKEIEVMADAVGFVFPIHAFTVPRPVRAFLKKLRLPNASYLFAVATRGGSPCRVFDHIDGLIRHTGKKLDATFIIDMPNNYLVSFDLPTAEEIAACEKAMLAKAAAMAAAIAARRSGREPDPHGNALLEHAVFPAMSALARLTDYGGIGRKFYADATCTGCGVCAQVCLSGKVAMRDGKPVWQKNVGCTFCFACINYCPARAIQLKGTKTPQKGRYVHPRVTAEDIAGQKK